jgi:hypothetical protein
MFIYICLYSTVCHIHILHAIHGVYIYILLRSCLQRHVPLQPGGQHLDGAVPDRLRPLSALGQLVHGLHGDARRDALRLRGL